jgi:hypothetical protein
VNADAWRDLAACLGTDPDAFFDPAVPAMEDVRDRLCRNCPVRKACLADTMEREQSFVAADRHGLLGYLSPGQRESAEKRGVLRCPKCNRTRDPVLLAQGILKCPVNCGQKTRMIPPLPHDGDQWTRRHTTLSQRIVAWVIDNTERGDVLPTPTHMAELLGGVRRSDVLRVYTAMVDDRTISRKGKEQVYTRRSPTGTLRTWYPAFLTTEPLD